MARQKFDRFMSAVDGEGIATALPLDEQYPRMYQPNAQVPVMPTSLSLRKHVWWGAGSRDTAVWAAQKGVNLMSSTLLTEANGDQFADLQADQLRLFRQAWKEAGHSWTPRTSVSRSIFPILSDTDRRMFGSGDDGGVGYIDDSTATFGRTYADEPDKLIEELKKDAAVTEADTLMLTIPSQLGRGRQPADSLRLRRTCRTRAGMGAEHRGPGDRLPDLIRHPRPRPHYRRPPFATHPREGTPRRRRQTTTFILQG
jgi:alkanesulfonate monooxygenase SsuD/methylene tetrahydromethanopterin reductase-like flavin-dependent oxidoreductase (luciferase family)